MFAIAVDGVEALRSIAYLVRDRDWGTYALSMSGVDIRQEEESFEVAYRALCIADNGATLNLTACIVGKPDRLMFEVESIPDADFETNRCGFVILHPIVALAGRPVQVEHVNGAAENSVYLISSIRISPL